MNDVPLALQPSLQTWGDLLAELERDAGQGSRVVTAARFDGVDQPSFRTAGSLKRPLSTLHGIEVDAADAAELLRDTVAMARESVPVLASSVCDAGQMFRRQEIAQAVRELPLLVNAVRTLVQLTDAASRASGTDIGGPQPSDAGCQQALMRIASALGGVTAAHQAEDWIALADGLEYELAPALFGWQAVLDAIPVGRTA